MNTEKEQLVYTSNAKQPSSIRSSLYALIVCFTNLSMGCVYAYTSPALPDINNNQGSFHLTLDEQAWVCSIVNVGAFFASLGGGWYMQQLGRKVCLIATVFLYIVGWLIVISANGKAQLLFGRFVAGICLGFTFILVPGYISEITTAKTRKSIGAYSSLMTDSGLLVMHFFGTFLSWRYLGLLCIGILTVHMVFLLNVPESPRWLMSRGLNEEVRTTLQLLRETDKVDEEFQEIQQHLECDAGSLWTKNGCSKIFHTPLLLSLILALLQVMTGSGYMWFFTLSIFNATAVRLNPHLQTILFGLSGVLGCVMSVFILDKYGRRPILITSAALMSCSLILLGLFFKMKYDHVDSVISHLEWLPVTTMFFHQMAYSIGWGPVPHILMSELLPTQSRIICTSIAQSGGWLLTFLLTQVSVSVAQSSIHEYGLFWIYALSTIASILFVFFFIPETKGKTLEEVQDYFSK